VSYDLEQGVTNFNNKKIKGAESGSFEVLDERFARDASRVYYRGKPVPADPATLEILGDEYVRDREGVFFIMSSRLKPLSGVDVGTFTSLGSGYGKDQNRVYRGAAVFRNKNLRVDELTCLEGFLIDSRHIYNGTDHFSPIPDSVDWRRIEHIVPYQNYGFYFAVEGRIYVSREAKAVEEITGVDIGSLEMMASENHQRDDRAVYFDFKKLPGLDPTRCRLVSNWEAGTTVVSDGESAYQGDRKIEDVDAGALCQVDDAVYVDGSWVLFDSFLGKDLQRFPSRFAELRELNESERNKALSGHFQSFAQHLLGIFDRHCLFHPIVEDVENQKDSPIPSGSRILISEGRLEISCRGYVFSGSPASLVTLLGRLWGLAKFGGKKGQEPVLRLLLSVGVMGAAPNFVHHSLVSRFSSELLQVASLLMLGGNQEEAREVVALVLELAPQRRTLPIDTQAEIYAWLDPESLPPQAFYDGRPATGRSTYLAAAKEVIEADQVLEHPSPWVRKGGVDYFYGLIAGTDKVPIFLKRFSRQLVERVNSEGNDRVREALLHCLELLAMEIVLLHERDLKSGFGNHFVNCYTDYFGLVLSCLMAHGINLDLNLARYWEWCLAVGRAAEAEEVGKKIAKLLPPDASLPGHYLGREDYRGYEEWMLAAKIRVAKSLDGIKAEEMIRSVMTDLKRYGKRNKNLPCQIIDIYRAIDSLCQTRGIIVLDPTSSDS